MRIRFFPTAFIVAFMFFFPTGLFAATFGITPSVLETEVERGDTLYGFVSLVRANPKEDTFILVSVREDEVGAIELTSGERFVLPLGEYDVQYTFAVDTSKLEGIDRFEAALEFLNEKPEAGGGAINQILGNVMKIDITITDGELGVGQVGETTQEESSLSTVVSDKQSGSTSTRWQAGFLAFLLVAVALGMSVIVWCRRTLHSRMYARVFLFCATLFLLSVFAWAYSSGRVLIHRWEDVWSMNIPILTDGAFFLVTSAGGSDTFLNPSTGQSQEMEGRWTYMATAPSRVYVMPADTQTDELYEKRFFLFYESGIKSLGSNGLPGIVSSVRENRFGTYAIFSGVKTEQDQTYWCLAEVWESIEIVCDDLDRLVNGEIQAAWFSPTEPHVVVVETSEVTYAYDVWRKASENLLASSQQEGKPLFVNPRPLETSAEISRWGAVRLDGVWVLARIGAEYYPLSPSLWLEKMPVDAGTSKISLVDSRTFLRLKIWDLSEGETLEHLQKDGLSTSP